MPSRLVGACVTCLVFLLASHAGCFKLFLSKEYSGVFPSCTFVGVRYPWMVVPEEGHLYSRLTYTCLLSAYQHI